MKNQDLIEILSKYPKDMDIVIVDSNCDDEEENTYDLNNNCVDLINAKNNLNEKYLSVIGLTFNNKFKKH